MRIILTQAEIEEAIENYIFDNVTVPDDFRIDMDLKATRGDEGYTAEIDILPNDAPKGDRSVDPRIQARPGAVVEGLGIVDKIKAAREQAAQPRRRGRPPGAKNRPKTIAEVEADKAANEIDPNQTVLPLEDNNASDTVESPTGNSDTGGEQPVQPEPAVEATVQPEAVVEADTVQTEEVIPEVAVDNTPAAAEVAAAVEPTPVVSNDVPQVEAEVAEAQATAATVPAEDVSTQANPVLADNLSAADDTTAEVAPETPPAPTRSLFANLQKPTNP